MTSVPQTGWQESDTEIFLRFADAFVPRRREQFSTVCSLLGSLPVPRLLELGCGAGDLTTHLLRALPSVRVVALDSAPHMVATARARLSPFGRRATVHAADLAGTAAHLGPWGAVVTSLAVHHLHDAGKQRLYRDVHDLLAPGGLFVQADMFRPTTATGVDAAARAWDRLVEEQSRTIHGDAEAFAAFRRTHWNTFRHPDPADHLAPLADQLRWLTEAGFTGVDVVWALAGHAVLTATRPGRETAR